MILIFVHGHESFEIFPIGALFGRDLGSQRLFSITSFRLIDEENVQDEDDNSNNAGNTDTPLRL